MTYGVESIKTFIINQVVIVNLPSDAEVLTMIKRDEKLHIPSNIQTKIPNDRALIFDCNFSIIGNDPRLLNVTAFIFR